MDTLTVIKKEKTPWFVVIFFSLCFFAINTTTISYNYFYLQILGDKQFFLIYNILAFGLQPFFGYLIDMKGREKILISTSLVIGCTVSFFPLPGFLSSVIFGITAGLIQVSAASLLFRSSGVRLLPLSIFIAFDILSVAIGNLYWEDKPFFAIFGIVLSLIILLFRNRNFLDDHVKESRNTIDYDIYSPIYLMLPVIIFRGFLHSFASNTFMPSAYENIGLYSSIILGRIAGAAVFQKGRADRKVFLSMIPAAVILAYYRDLAAVYFIGLFFLNMSAVFTLFLFIRLFRNLRAFAFGLYSFTLLVGTYGGSLAPASPLLGSVLTLVTCALITKLTADAFKIATGLSSADLSP